MNVSQDVSFVPSAPRQIPHTPRQQTRGYTPEDWESKKSEIKILYVKGDMKPKQVMGEMVEPELHATYVHTHLFIIMLVNLGCKYRSLTTIQ